MKIMTLSTFLTKKKACQFAFFAAGYLLSFGALSAQPHSVQPKSIQFLDGFAKIGLNWVKDDYTLTFTPCQYIIESYYDELDACDPINGPACPAFPSNNQPILKVTKEVWDSDNNTYHTVTVSSASAQCKFEPRQPGQVRTEKGWTPITFIPNTNYWDTNSNSLNASAQSVVVATSAVSSSQDPATITYGVWRCGYDGHSNVTSGNYVEDLLLDRNQPNGVSRVLNYAIAGEFLSAQSTMVFGNVQGIGTSYTMRDLIKGSFLSELHPDSYQIAADCNSSCIEPSFEIYIQDNNAITHITPGSSQQNQWAVRKITQPGGFDKIFPLSVVFSEEYSTMQMPDMSQGFLPGGAIFGFNSNTIYIR